MGDNLQEPPESNDAPKPGVQATFVPPFGWTNRTADLQMDYYWNTNDGIGHEACTWRGITVDANAATMRNNRTAGDSLYIFSDTASNPNYYVWNLIENEIYKITEPKKWSDILQKMKGNKGKMTGIEVEIVEEI
ncbi:hypothetical protein TWF718_005789 [Orbilia javanica]|uniref:Uncharacterized protein n=1 Tax=Orbilia javanica TaxID=47235 RepID=A0AAN8MVN5_9PEZI